jgi:hypothetical protein
MATPIYNAAWRNPGGSRQSGGRSWGIVTGAGSMLGGKTPQYLGAGQPAAEDSGSLFGDGTPVYRLAPPSTTAPHAVTAPSTGQSDATAQPSGPQPGPMAIVVRRS